MKKIQFIRIKVYNGGLDTGETKHARLIPYEVKVGVVRLCLPSPIHIEFTEKNIKVMKLKKLVDSVVKGVVECPLRFKTNGDGLQTEYFIDLQEKFITWESKLKLKKEK